MKRYEQKLYFLLIVAIIIIGLMYIAFVFMTFKDMALVLK